MTDRETRSEPQDAKPDRAIDGVVSLIQKLTGELIPSGSMAEMFGVGFRTLCDVLQFDVAVAVVLEQNLYLYISTRPDLPPLVNDALMDRVRAVLEQKISVSFGSTDAIVRAERNDLPCVGPSVTAVPHELSAVLEVENRTSGLLVLFRGNRPFGGDDASILTIFSAHLALHIGNFRARERIMQLADTDELTGIANKRHFRRRLLYEMDRARVYNLPLTLLLLDIDEFKQINDTFGHTMGDVLLSEFCGTVHDSLRQPDFFARFGGDEFAVILPHTDVAGACSVSDRIMEQVRELTLYTDDQTQVRCSVSIGIAEFRADEMLPEEFVRRADLRLYDSKRLGKNRYTA
ncbi:MAG: sensor domain-containing diguanylate cyclase [Thermoanaerobaculia bacterium]